MWMAWFYGWMYCANTYLAFLVGRDGVYSILAWGEKEGDFPLSTYQIFSYSIWGGMTVIHASLYAFDQVSFIFVKLYHKSSIRTFLIRISDSMENL